MPTTSKSALELPGGTAVWVFVCVELITFGLFFLAFAHSYANDPTTFASSQALLHPTSGLVNTAILLTGSWLVARGALAHQAGESPRWWFGATAVSGCVFVAIKAVEYSAVFEHDITLSTNLFWFYYLFLTFLHLLHVVGGVAVAGYMALKTGRAAAEHELAVEATATYWHLVDLVWIVLFPLIYLAG